MLNISIFILCTLILTKSDFILQKIMLRMTKVLSKNIYHVDLDAVELNRRLSTTPERHFHRRRPSKNRTRHLSLRGAYRHKSSGSNSSREEIMGSDFSVSIKSANESRKSGRRPLCTR